MKYDMVTGMDKMGTHGIVEAVVIFKKRRKRERCQATGFTWRGFY